MEIPSQTYIYIQEQGVTQGSILSTVLFNLKLNNIVKDIPSIIQKSLYVDDMARYFRCRTMSIIERQIQHAINKIQNFADDNGFKFSPQKTTCIHF